MTARPPVIRRLGAELYDLSPRRALGVLKRLATSSRRGAKTAARSIEPASIELLRSSAYRELMQRHLPYGGLYDLHEAQNETRSFRFRHHEMAHVLGLFRWRGISEHLDLVLALATDPGRRVVDLGGAASPLGFGSIVVDHLERDAFDRPVIHRDLANVPGKVDAVFTSHTLEHVPDLTKLLREVADKLEPGGRLVAHVPAFSCERWRAGQHTSARYSDHVWTFGLSKQPHPPDLVNYIDIDTSIREHLRVLSAEPCGDDSLFVVAVKA